jgi:hypothetical protein
MAGFRFRKNISFRIFMMHGQTLPVLWGVTLPGDFTNLIPDGLKRSRREFMSDPPVQPFFLPRTRASKSRQGFSQWRQGTP